MPLRRLLVGPLVVWLVVLVGAPVSVAQEIPPPATTTTAPPTTTPDTSACPWSRSPMPPVDASEVPAPGETAPPPLPVPDPPVGGLTGCGVLTPPGTPPVPEGLTASGWVVADLDTGEVLAAKDPHGRYRPASTIKLLTASLALTSLDLDQVVVGTLEDAAVEGSGVGIGPDGRYTVRDLLLGLLLSSGNDAANALSRAMGGVGPTVEAANALARSLGTTDTRVVTPSGLDAPGTSTSPYDLALIYRHAASLPGYSALNTTRETLFPGYGDNPPFLVGNDNALLAAYPDATGAKNGFTDDARHTFVGAAERGGRRLVVTLTHAERVPRQPWEQTASLLDWGFALPAGTPAVGTLVDGPAAPSPSAPTVTATPAAPGPVQALDPPAPGAASQDGAGAVTVAAAALLVALAGAVLALRARRP